MSAASETPHDLIGILRTAADLLLDVDCGKSLVAAIVLLPSYGQPASSMRAHDPSWHTAMPFQRAGNPTAGVNVTGTIVHARIETKSHLTHLSDPPPIVPLDLRSISIFCDSSACQTIELY